jgi:hypothetical protein
LPTELIEHFVLIILGNSSVIYLFIALLIPLRPLVGLRPPSKIPSFSHYMPTVSLSVPPKTHSRRRSLFMRVLSLSDTHYISGV